jgi:hypothetical protein
MDKGSLALKLVVLPHLFSRLRICCALLPHPHLPSHKFGAIMRVLEFSMMEEKKECMSFKVNVCMNKNF